MMTGNDGLVILKGDTVTISATDSLITSVTRLGRVEGIRYPRGKAPTAIVRLSTGNTVTLPGVCLRRVNDRC